MTDRPTPPPDDSAWHPAPSELCELVDGELDPARGRQLADHVAACESCREEHERLSLVRSVLGRLSNAPPVGAAAGAISAALGALDDTARPAAATVVVLATRRRFSRLAGIAAAVVLLAALGSGIGWEVSRAPTSSSSALGTTTTEILGSGGGHTPGKTAQQVIELRRLENHLVGQLVTDVTSSEVARLQSSPSSGGSFRATLTLEPGTPVLAALRAEGGRTVVAVRDGKVLGVVQAAANGIIEITGLNRSGALELTQTLG